MKPSAAAIELLKSAFAWKGKVMCSATDTCHGTKRQWAQLEKAGFVKPHGRMPTMLGHLYSYAITPEGKTAAEQALTEGGAR